MLVIGFAMAAVPFVGTIGGDARWLAALGAAVSHNGIPDGVPYATAPTAAWENPLVLAELLFHALYTLDGDQALLLAQIAGVGIGLGWLARDARDNGACAVSTAAVLALVLVGAFPSLTIVRLQLFSITFFPLLLWLLRRDARAPSGRIFWVIPLIAVWSNLHAGVLIGVGVTGIYLMLDRLRRARKGETVLLGLAVLLAPLANPALLGTPEYFHELTTNEAARRSVGLWAPLGSGAVDLLLILTALVLAVFAVRAPLRLWEAVAAAVLAAATVHAARSGIWLLFLIAMPAARALRLPTRLAPRLALPLLAAMAVNSTYLVASTDLEPNWRVVDRAVAVAHGRPILGEGALVEQAALDGGRIWVGNPLEAFTHHDQRLYVAWLLGEPEGDSALQHANVVLVRRGGHVEARLLRTERVRRIARDGATAAYELVGPSNVTSTAPSE